MVETYTGRWSIETTLQEMRAYLGLETTRGWKEATVLRLAPCLFGLFSVVAVLYDLLPARTRAAGRVAWPGKVETTFSDAITAVRRWLWVNWVFANHGYGAAFSKLSRPFQEALLSALRRPRNGGKRAEDELSSDSPLYPNYNRPGKRRKGKAGEGGPDRPGKSSGRGRNNGDRIDVSVKRRLKEPDCLSNLRETDSWLSLRSKPRDFAINAAGV